MHYQVELAPAQAAAPIHEAACRLAFSSRISHSSILRLLYVLSFLYLTTKRPNLQLILPDPFQPDDLFIHLHTPLPTQVMPRPLDYAHPPKQIGRQQRMPVRQQPGAKIQLILRIAGPSRYRPQHGVVSPVFIDHILSVYGKSQLHQAAAPVPPCPAWAAGSNSLPAWPYPDSGTGCPGSYEPRARR